MTTLFERFADAIINKYSVKKPYIIGRNDNPYIHRWFIIPRNKFFNIYLHHILQSDVDFALHDHPSFNISIILRGRYVEIFKEYKTIRYIGDVVFRRAKTAHRLKLSDHDDAWSLWISGPKYREWGFHCPSGWKSYKECITKTEDGNTTTNAIACD